MEWPTTLGQAILFYISLPLNVIHMFLYFRPKEGRPDLVGLGLVLIPLPLALPQFLGPELAPAVKMGLLILVTLFFSAAVFRLLVFEGGFGRILFGVLTVSAFNNMSTILIYAVLLQGLRLPADEGTYLLTRGVYAGVCLVSFPIFYRRVRQPFIRILDAVENSSWYINCLSPLMLTFLGYFATLAAFSYPGLLMMSTSVMLAAALPGFYLLLYNVIISRDMNALLSNELTFSRRLITIYDHYDEELSKREKSLQLMRHDLHHRLGRLDGLTLSGDYQALRQCIAEIAESVVDFELGAHCDDRVVNAIISYHFAGAIRQGVRCSAGISLDAELTLSDIEMAVLLGNALENCVKAAIPLGANGRISLAARPVRDRMVFKFENNYLENRYTPGQGLGLRSIRLICDRHGGVMEISRDRGEFLLTVILPLKNKPLPEPAPGGNRD